VRWAVLALPLALAACGPQAQGGGDALRFEFTLAAALNDQLSGLQVSIVDHGTSLNCGAVEQGCLVDQVTRDRFVQVKDAQGQSHLALVFPLALVAGTPSTQNVQVGGITPGKDYAVVIEALSKDEPPQLAGSSCNYEKEIVAGDNPQLIAATIVPPATPVACDPRVER
jgi:hypothetical protein